MKILIIGASSYVGARLYFDLTSKFDVTGTYATKKLSKDFIHLDIINKEEVERVIKENRPNVIVHVANSASAKWCDANPEAAVLLNQTATQYIVDSPNKVGTMLIYISIMGAIKPSNLYGRTKLKSEEIVKTTKNGYVILRPSLIVGYSPNTTNDRPLNRLLKNLDQGTPVVYDIARDILTPFGIKVTPVDARDSTFEIFEDDLSELRELDLPKYSYQKMITAIVDEVKNRAKFVI